MKITFISNNNNNNSKYIYFSSYFVTLETIETKISKGQRNFNDTSG